jgi:hypothetical protein
MPLWLAWRPGMTRFSPNPWENPRVDFARELDEVRAFLVDRGFRFAVVGGVALAAYGHRRLTHDLDVVTDSAQDAFVGMSSPGPTDARPLDLDGDVPTTAADIENLRRLRAETSSWLLLPPAELEALIPDGALDDRPPTPATAKPFPLP